MSRVVHFEIPANDPARCERFYQQAFGWAFHKWDGPQEYWLVQTGTEARGIDGGMAKRRAPDEGTVNTIQVESLDEALRKVQAAGGAIAVPKMPIQGMGWIAYCTDTESNLFGLMEPDESAR